MTSKVRAAGLMALIAASFAPGCGEGGPRSGGAPTKPPPQVAFVTADLSTGVRIASVQISDSGIDVSAEIVNTIAAAVRVSTWPRPVVRICSSGVVPITSRMALSATAFTASSGWRVEKT